MWWMDLRGLLTPLFAPLCAIGQVSLPEGLTKKAPMQPSPSRSRGDRLLNQRTTATSGSLTLPIAPSSLPILLLPAYFRMLGAQDEGVEATTPTAAKAANTNRGRGIYGKGRSCQTKDQRQGFVLLSLAGEGLGGS